MRTQPLRVLTWHIHGSYLYYLSQANLLLYVPVKSSRPPRYSGRSGSFPWGSNVREVDATQVPELEIDCILFQTKENYIEDIEILSRQQRALPKIYLEHDPPRQHPTDAKHIIQDREMLLVHVTHFNALMWDSSTPARVIEHGVVVPKVRYTGEIEKGVVVVNNIARRGRRVGVDIFQRVRRHVPLDLIGMDSEGIGGIGALSHEDMLHLIPRYRFFFNPIRYTSLGLSLCEAMMLGVPVVGLATTEVPVHLKHYAHTNVEVLVAHMRRLLQDPSAAARAGIEAKKYAEEHFSIERFAAQWEETIDSFVRLHRSAISGAKHHALRSI